MSADATGTTAVQRLTGVRLYELLREEVISGQLMPNERLIEADLSARFGTSRALIRTALARLEQDGLVIREPHKGARVRHLSQDEAAEILEIRASLESVGAARAARNATAPDVKTMREIIDRQHARHSDGDVFGASEVNAELHSFILTVARSPTLVELVTNLRARAVRYQFRTGTVPGRPEASVAEHSAIVEAIAVHDEDAAAAAMRYHIQSVGKAVRQSRSR